MNVIPIKNKKIWRAMNDLKTSIKSMRALKDSKYSSAISKDEALLREFFGAIVELSHEAAAKEAAA